jgi:hypothetical protein
MQTRTKVYSWNAWSSETTASSFERKKNTKHRITINEYKNHKIQRGRGATMWQIQSKLKWSMEATKMIPGSSFLATWSCTPLWKWPPAVAVVAWEERPPRSRTRLSRAVTREEGQPSSSRTRLALTLWGRCLAASGRRGDQAAAACEEEGGKERRGRDLVAGGWIRDYESGWRRCRTRVVES